MSKPYISVKLCVSVIKQQLESSFFFFSFSLVTTTVKKEKMKCWEDFQSQLQCNWMDTQFLVSLRWSFLQLLFLWKTINSVLQKYSMEHLVLCLQPRSIRNCGGKKKTWNIFPFLPWPIAKTSLFLHQGGPCRDSLCNGGHYAGPSMQCKHTKQFKTHIDRKAVSFVS